MGQTSRRTLKKGSRRRGPANLEDQKRPRRPEEGHSKRAAEKEVLKQVFWQTTNKTSNENTKGGISRRFSRQSPPLRTDAEETSQTSRRSIKKGSRRRGPANLEDQKRPRRPAEGHSKRAAEKEVLQQVFWQTTNQTSNEVTKGELVAAFQGKVPP